MSQQLEDIEELSEPFEPKTTTTTSKRPTTSCRAVCAGLLGGLGALWLLYKLARFTRIPQALVGLGALLLSYRASDGCFGSLVSLASAAGFLLVAFKLACLGRSAVRGARWYLFEQRADLVQRYGKWACVAGATGGVGFGLARELARRGHSIVALGRDELKLARAKTLLEAESAGCEVVTIKLDLADSAPENFQAIVEKLAPEQRDLGILINAAGVCTDSFKRFHRYELHEIRRVLHVNALAVMYLTNLVLPGMLKRQRGLILNVSSPSGYLTVPYVGAYGPTKALVNSFTQLLQTEYKHTPLDIVYLTGNGVDTKLYLKLAALKSRLFDLSPEAYAKSVLNAISVPGTRTLAGAWTHEIKNLAFRFLHFFDWMPLAMSSNFYFKRLRDAPLFDDALEGAHKLD